MVKSKGRIDSLIIELEANFGKPQADRAREMWEALLLGDGDKSSLESAIKRNLDANSIYAFFHLISEMAQELGESEKQSERANIRHAENHAIKDDVFKWLDSNMSAYKSIDAAAEAIAGKVAPVTFRTAQGWVGEWKKLRSAGTA